MSKSQGNFTVVPTAFLLALAQSLERLVNEPEKESKDQDRDWLSIARAAKRIVMSPWFIRQAMRRGELTWAEVNHNSQTPCFIWCA